MESRINKIKKAVPIVFGIAFLYGLLRYMGITCIIKFLTGISCPGCGMTRGVLAALRGDFSLAFYYHPLFIIPFIGGGVYIFSDKIKKESISKLIILAAVMLIAVYIYRLLGDENDIVCVRIEEGLIYKAYVFVSELLKK